MFNWKIYKELYPELSRSLKSPPEFINHYNKVGKKLGLKGIITQLYPDFYWETYKEKYEDLANLNREDTELHWIKVGRIEGRNYKIGNDLVVERRIFRKYKCACIVYHSNKRHTKTDWINKCVNSIFAQSFCEFDIHELNYSGDHTFYFMDYYPKIKGEYYSHNKIFNNSYEAMTYLTELCLGKLNYDIVFNVDVYDYYEHERFIYQLNEIERGNVLCSSLAYFINRIDNNDKLVSENNTMFYDREIKIITNSDYKFPLVPIIIPPENIKKQILNNQNIVLSTGYCISKTLWLYKDSYGNSIRFRNDYPYNEISYLKRVVRNGLNISVVNKNQIFKRVHYEPNNEYQEYSINDNLDIYQICIIMRIDNVNNLNEILNIKYGENITINYIFFSDKIELGEMPNQTKKNIILIKKSCMTFEEVLKEIGYKIYHLSDYIIYIKNYNYSNKYSIVNLRETDTNDLLIIKTNRLYELIYYQKKALNFICDESDYKNLVENVFLEIIPITYN
jgi:hypothetical protein